MPSEPLTSHSIDLASDRARDRMTLSDWRWSAPGAQVAAVLRGILIALPGRALGTELGNLRWS
jgi:hypothetical protein